MTVKLVSAGRRDRAILAINDSFDCARIESESFNSNILATSCVANVFTDFKDDRNGFSLIAIGVIEIAHHGLSWLNGSISGLPHHGDVLAFSNGVFTNNTSDSADLPVGESGLGVNAVFEIDLISTNFSVNEWELISFEIFDEIHG